MGVDAFLDREVRPRVGNAFLDLEARPRAGNAFLNLEARPRIGNLPPPPPPIHHRNGLEANGDMAIPRYPLAFQGRGDRSPEPLHRVLSDDTFASPSLGSSRGNRRLTGLHLPVSKQEQEAEDEALARAMQEQEFGISTNTNIGEDEAAEAARRASRRHRRRLYTSSDDDLRRW